MSHYERCLARAQSYADVLIARIKKKEINASSFEGAMIGYLNQPAFCDYRSKLLDAALARFDAATTPSPTQSQSQSQGQ